MASDHHGHKEWHRSSLVPRLRFDLLAKLSIQPVSIETLVQQSAESQRSAHCDSDDALKDERTKSTALPFVHAHTARVAIEKSDSVQLEHSINRCGVQTARIRFAPPLESQHQQRPVKPSSSSPSSLSRSSHGRSSNQSTSDTALAWTYDDESFAQLKALAKDKRATTARCFHALRALQQHCSSSATKTMLQSIYAVLHATAYSTSHQTIPVDANNAGNNLVSASADSSQSSDGSKSDYFSLLIDSHATLQALDHEIATLESQLAMEQTLESEFQTQLRLLDDAHEQIERTHAASTQQITIECAAVRQLESEYSALLTQEYDAKRECVALALQVDKQTTQLHDVRAKAVAFERMSRAPLKQHADDIKRREQRDALVRVAQYADDDNAALEAELAALDAQVATVEQQLVHETAAKQQLECAVYDAHSERARIDAACRRARDCHTPRPLWDAVIAQTPELSHELYEWDEPNALGSATSADSDDDDDADSSVQSTMQRESFAATSALDIESDAERGWNVDNTNDDDDDAIEQQQQALGLSSPGRPSGRTTKLVREMLHWIERLQKHCGVNLHLSRIWHDIEEARVELNILHQQLDRAVRTRHHRHASPTAKTKSSASPSKREYIVALGTHDAIPRFLRHQGKVPHRVLKKGELETLIRQVWTEKRKREARNPLATIALDDVLYDKLQRTYGFQPLIAEWGYNILLGLSAYIWDAEIELFLLCLTHAVSDLVFNDQEQLLASCQSLLHQLSASYTTNESFATERRVLLKDALVTLRKFFPLKTSVQLQAIEKAMIRDMHKRKRGSGTDSILYIDDILPLKVSYARGFFVKTVRTQHWNEIQDYYALVTTELEQHDLAHSGRLPLSHIKDAIVQIDPLADANAVLAALAKGVGVKTRTQLNLHDVVDYRAVLKKMNTSCLMKFTLNFDLRAEFNWQKHHVPATFAADV